MGVEPAVAPPPGNPRFPLFDGLRAIAALSVLVYHTAFYSGAHQQSGIGPVLTRLNIGVAIFFVISGFLLYRPFAAARMESRPGPGVAAYARRRFLRIVPAYWVALTILAFYPGVYGLWSGAWPRYYGFAQVYSADTVLGGIGPAWTLCTEVAFYAILPVYAWAVARVLRSRPGAVRIELVLLGVLALASVAVRAIAVGSGHATLALTLPAMFAWFAVGMALAVVSAAAATGSLKAPAVPAVAAWLAAAGLYLVLSYVLGAPKTSIFAVSQNSREALFEFVMSAAIAGLLVLPAVFGRGGAPRRLLAAPVVGWLGLVSYGIYLWHEPVIRWLFDEGLVDRSGSSPFLVATVLAVAVTVPIAALSYYLLERPILRFKEGRPGKLVSRRRRRGVPAAAPAAGAAPGEPGGPAGP